MTLLLSFLCVKTAILLVCKDFFLEFEFSNISLKTKFIRKKEVDRDVCSKNTWQYMCSSKNFLPNAYSFCALLWRFHAFLSSFLSSYSHFVPQRFQISIQVLNAKERKSFRSTEDFLKHFICWILKSKSRNGKQVHSWWMSTSQTASGHNNAKQSTKRTHKKQLNRRHRLFSLLKKANQSNCALPANFLRISRHFPEGPCAVLWHDHEAEGIRPKNFSRNGNTL